MNRPLILSLDIGSSSIRAALYNGEANPIPRTLVKFEYAFTATANGGSEIDADHLLSHVTDTIDAAVTKADRIRGEIEYVASCSFWHSLVGIDARGKPTTKVLGWADTQSREYSGVLKKRFDEAAVHNRTGAHFHSSFWPAKLLWLRREFPEIFQRTAHWLSFCDYVALKLSERVETSLSMASATGIFDIRKCDWDDELLKYLKIKRSSLPEIAKDSTVFQLDAKCAKRWPRLRNAGWYPAIGDGAADNIGSGCTTPGKAALMIGTSGAMRVIREGKTPDQIPDGLWCYRVDRRRVIVGGALSDGGNLYGWLKANLKLPKGAEEEMRRRGAAAHGLTFLPFFFGERSIGYGESAAGAIHGLTARHDSVDILQAAIESTAYRLAEIFERLNTVIKVEEIVTSGGALRESPVWIQVIADVLGRDLVLNATTESSLRGAVLLALESLGKIESIDKFVTPTVSTLAYHPACHAVYNLERKRHRTLYQTFNK